MTSRVTLDCAPVRTEPAYRAVARLIESKILKGEWSIGNSLPSELALAEGLGVNRSTIREAIRVLEENGLVRRNGGKRLFVSAPLQSDISPRISAAIVLREISFSELWESMRCLEPVLAAGAASRITPAEVDAIQENVERTRDGLANKQTLVELDIEFHNLVAAASRNRALQLCREPISQLFYPAFFQVFSRLNAGERLVFAHQKILDALRNGDAEDARSWMDKHIVDFRRGYELANCDLSRPVEWPEGR
jgi:GntR family transcriptional regulator, transcriptional repressor for pyruvate dehydrogenase complex